jgi:hypothetical protein
MEGLVSGPLERVLCTLSFRKAMPSPRLAGGGLHTLKQHLLIQLLPLWEPCAVKMVSDKEYQYEFD